MSRSDAMTEPCSRSSDQGVFVVQVALSLDFCFALMCVLVRVFARHDLHLLCLLSTLAPGALLPLAILAAWGLPVRGLRHRQRVATSLAVASEASSSAAEGPQPKRRTKGAEQAARRTRDIEMCYEENYRWAEELNFKLNPVNVFLGRGLHLPRSCLDDNSFGACLVRMLVAILVLPMYLMYLVFHIGFVAVLSMWKALAVAHGTMEGSKPYRCQDVMHDLGVYIGMLVMAVGLSLSRLALAHGFYTWWSTAWFRKLPYGRIWIFAVVIHAVSIATYMCAVIADVAYTPAPLLTGELAVLVCSMIASSLTFCLLAFDLSSQMMKYGLPSAGKQAKSDGRGGCTVTEANAKLGARLLAVASTRGFHTRDTVLIGGTEEAEILRRHRVTVVLDRDLKKAYPAGTEVRRIYRHDRFSTTAPEKKRRRGTGPIPDVEKGMKQQQPFFQTDTHAAQVGSPLGSPVGSYSPVDWLAGGLEDSEQVGATVLGAQSIDMNADMQHFEPQTGPNKPRRKKKHLSYVQ
mmetsp:Transcript_43666/g.79662  ORF Transcript_43666/g.79662 Transcript_43666/m.79662 type:complete len:518 (+) Transcript_43666:59-1612(+)